MANTRTGKSREFLVQFLCLNKWSKMPVLCNYLALSWRLPALSSTELTCPSPWGISSCCVKEDVKISLQCSRVLTALPTAENRWKETWNETDWCYLLVSREACLVLHRYFPQGLRRYLICIGMGSNTCRKLFAWYCFKWKTIQKEFFYLLFQRC